MKNFITIYGKIYKRTIQTDEGLFYLVDNSHVRVPKSGWFWVRKVGSRWKIYRQLIESEAEVYPNWNSQQIDRWIDFVSLSDRHEYAQREEIERRHIRPLFHENPISKKLTLNY